VIALFKKRMCKNVQKSANFECSNCPTSRVGLLPILKMGDRPFLVAKKMLIGNRPFFAQFCLFALFETAIVQSLFLKCKKV